MPDTNNASPFNHAIARIVVGAYDDSQDQRTAMMNRIRDLIRKRNEGIPFDVVEAEKDPEDRTFESKYSDDNLPDLIVEMRREGKLTDDEFEYIDQILQAAQAAARVENSYQDIMRITEAEPIYSEWLVDVYGVSHTLTARLLHVFGYCGPARVVNIEPEGEPDEVIAHEVRDGYGAVMDAADRAASDPALKVKGFPRVSNLWSYSGMAPGQTRRRGEKLSYNPDAKTLAWLVADGMIKQGDRSRYRKAFYDPYKAKQEERMAAVEDVEYEVQTVQNESGTGTVPATFEVVGENPDGSPELGDMLFTGTPPESQAHAHNRAVRYLAKKFLKHYWAIARDIQGWETPDDYITTVGGHDKYEDSFENPFHAKRVITTGATPAD